MLTDSNCTRLKSRRTDEALVVAKFATTTKYGAIEGKTQTTETKFYNLARPVFEVEKFDPDNSKAKKAPADRGCKVDQA